MACSICRRRPTRLRLFDAASATPAIENRALLTVAYDTLARRSDLVAMQVQDVAIGADGHGTVTIRRGKTDQESVGSERNLTPNTSRLIVVWLDEAEVLLGGTSIIQRQQ